MASVSCEDPNFTVTDEGGAIAFQASGGAVVLKVDCGTDWIAANQAEDILSTKYDTGAGTLTITMGQNTVKQDRTGRVILRTAAKSVTFATITVTQDAYGTPELSVDTSRWNIPAAGELTAEIGVSCTLDDWTAESSAEWLTVERVDGGVALTAQENDRTATRSATVTLTCDDGVRARTAYIWVYQDARAYISLSSESVSIRWDGGSAEVTVESNYDWDCALDGTADWLTVRRDNSVITLTAEAYDGESNREATLVFTGGDGAQNTAEARLEVVQKFLPEPMILSYTTTLNYSAVTLPLDGTVDCIVDWGDGSSEEVLKSLPSHTYNNAGQYDVSIYGTVTALNSRSVDSDQRSLLTAVKQWGATELVSMERAFYQCTGLKSIPADTSGSFAEVTSLAQAFRQCTALESIPEGLFTYAVKNTTCNLTFYSCARLTSLPADLFSTCTEITTFSECFECCTGLTALPETLFANNAKVTSFYGTFYETSGITSVPENLFAACPEATDFTGVFWLSGIKSIPAGIFASNPKATIFTDAFTSCLGLESIPDGLFSNNTAANDFEYVFYKCSNLKNVGSKLFAGCTGASTFQHAFRECTSLETVPGDIFNGCTTARLFGYLFQNCTALKSVPESLFGECANAASFVHTFSGCSAFAEIPEKIFANCPLVYSFFWTFANNTSLKSIPPALFANNLQVTSFFYTFTGCANLTGESPYNLIDGVKVHLYERLNDEYKDYFGVSSIYTTGCFRGCTGLDDYATMPSTWQ